MLQPNAMMMMGRPAFQNHVHAHPLPPHIPPHATLQRNKTSNHYVNSNHGGRAATSFPRQARPVRLACLRERGRGGRRGSQAGTLQARCCFRRQAHSCDPLSYTNRAAVDAETFDLGGLNEAQVSGGEARAGGREGQARCCSRRTSYFHPPLQVTQILSSAFATPFEHLTEMVRLTFVVGGGKGVRARYDDSMPVKGEGGRGRGKEREGTRKRVRG